MPPGPIVAATVPWQLILCFYCRALFGKIIVNINNKTRCRDTGHRRMIKCIKMHAKRGERGSRRWERGGPATPPKTAIKLHGTQQDARLDKLFFCESFLWRNAIVYPPTPPASGHWPQPLIIAAKLFSWPTVGQQEELLQVRVSAIVPAIAGRRKAINFACTPRTPRDGKWPVV